MQCDVEIGSNDDHQVYLLVPEHHVIQVRLELTAYLTRLANLRPSTVLNYTPTAAVITNVGFLRAMAHLNVWTNHQVLPVPPPRYGSLDRMDKSASGPPRTASAPHIRQLYTNKRNSSQSTLSSERRFSFGRHRFHVSTNILI